MDNQTNEPQPCICVIADQKLEIRPLIRDWQRRGIRVDVRGYDPKAGPAPAAIRAELLVLGFAWTPAGQSYLRQVREKFSGPIVICLGRIDAKTEALALESGADAYLELDQPVSLAWARVSALFRRERREAGCRQQDLLIGDFTIKDSRREIYLKDRLLDMNELQYNLLRYLVLHAGEVATRDDISKALFNREFDGLDRTIDIHISRLRRTLQDNPWKPVYLKTVRGQGYLLVK